MAENLRISGFLLSASYFPQSLVLHLETGSEGTK